VGKSVVITGIGMVTPLGASPEQILTKINRGEAAFSLPPFSTDDLYCPRYAVVRDFDAERTFSENKTLRLMNRDAHLAVTAARKAMLDAQIEVENTYPSEEIGLYGSTGMAGLALDELTVLIRHAAREDGSLDLARFGRDVLKRTRPVLSFKILANMPICFVSIFENLRGPNAIYTPWKGQSACAIAAGDGSRGPRFSPEGISRFRACQSLKRLRLTGCAVDDSALVALASNLSELDDLFVGSTRITDSSLSAIRKLRHLTWFNCANTKVTDAGISAIGDHPSIETISLEGTHVSNASLAVLATMPKLKNVWSSADQFTGTALAEFEKRRRDVRISVVEGAKTRGQIPVDSIGR
jgi:hypothetical protein